MESQVVHIIHNPELFLASRALSSRHGIAHVIHNLKLFIASRALSSQTRVVHVNYNPKLFIESRSFRTRDLESIISSTTLSSLLHVEP